jgi:hypothetical protein
MVAGAMCAITSSALTWLAWEGSIRRVSDRGDRWTSDDPRSFHSEQVVPHLTVIIALKQVKLIFLMDVKMWYR